jgi:hypothetical protein
MLLLLLLLLLLLVWLVVVVGLAWFGWLVGWLVDGCLSLSSLLLSSFVPACRWCYSAGFANLY